MGRDEPAGRTGIFRCEFQKGSVAVLRAAMRRLAACEYAAGSELQVARIREIWSRISNLVYKPENAQVKCPQKVRQK